MASLRYLVLAAALCVALVQGRRLGRLVDGKKKSIEKAPWLVQLYDAGIVCAGSIIDSRTVLSAAHCFESLDDPTEAKILVGATGFFDGQSGDIYPIESVTEHPKYNGGEQMYDLVIVKLAKSIEFNDKVQPIELANQRVSEGTTVHAGGWGDTTDFDEPSKFPSQLKMAKLTKKSSEECTEYLKYVTNISKKSGRNMLCLLPETGAPCGGDSGSGLWVYPDGEDKPAKLFGTLQGATTCSPDEAVPLYVDLLNEEIQDFLVENGAIEERKV